MLSPGHCLQRVPEVRRTVAHPPQLLRIIAHTILGHLALQCVPLCIDTLVRKHSERHGYQANPDEHQLQCICKGGRETPRLVEVYTNE